MTLHRNSEPTASVSSFPKPPNYFFLVGIYKFVKLGPTVAVFSEITFYVYFSSVFIKWIRMDRNVFVYR